MSCCDNNNYNNYVPSFWYWLVLAILIIMLIIMIIFIIMIFSAIAKAKNAINNISCWFKDMIKHGAQDVSIVESLIRRILEELNISVEIGA
jgi:hypothetical protein